MYGAILVYFVSSQINRKGQTSPKVPVVGPTWKLASTQASGYV
jgi:hypothetical protein